MPSFRKLSSAEAAALDHTSVGVSAEIARAYDTYLADFAADDYGRAELLDGEQRAVVRRRLQAAAGRRGLVLRFRSGPGPLTFQVAAAPAITAILPQEPRVTTPVAAPIVDRRAPPPARPARQPKSAAERYRDVLPRWMRSSEQAGQRNSTPKRRPR